MFVYWFGLDVLSEHVLSNKVELTGF